MSESRATGPRSPRAWHRLVWGLSWPIILANLTIPLVGLADIAVMGRLPEPMFIGAVALGTAIMNALYWMFGFLRMATTGLAAQAFGAGNLAEVSAIPLRAGAVAVLFGCLTIALQVPIATLLMWLFDASDGVEQLAGEYFAIRVWGAPALLLYFVELGVLFALQKMRATLLLSLTLNLMNVALDVGFVLGLGWGVQGVAAGTVISEWSACVLGALIVIRTLERLGAPRPVVTRLLDIARARALFHIGGNLILRTFFVQLPFFALTMAGAVQGDLVLAANAVLLQFFYLTAYVLDGYAHSVEALAGHAFGGRDSARLRAAVWYGGCQAFATAILIALLWLVAGERLVAALTTLSDVRATASIYLPWLAALPLAAVFAFLFDGIFIGTTRIVELRNSMLFACTIFVAALALTFERFGNHGVWFALNLFMIARSLLLARHYPALARRAGAPT